ncbi:hypothetical protein Q8A73_008301 [Channa argus]|nr:hypothetical protein Q8A73_008301 [Channa argus]
MEKGGTQLSQAGVGGPFTTIDPGDTVTIIYPLIVDQSKRPWTGVSLKIFFPPMQIKPYCLKLFQTTWLLEEPSFLLTSALPHPAPLAARAQTKLDQARPDLLLDRAIINTEISRSLSHIPTVQQHSPQVPATVTSLPSSPSPNLLHDLFPWFPGAT